MDHLTREEAIEIIKKSKEATFGNFASAFPVFTFFAAAVFYLGSSYLQVQSNKEEIKSSFVSLSNKITKLEEKIDQSDRRDRVRMNKIISDLISHKTWEEGKQKGRER